ncbi:MAG TPA: glycoside hydrolase family 3 N-terminal domain-containing protein [Solirubrobacteraceae bacterium]|nr:glycoside hydrolase family 3 N-terminal domain-containing protein [Solirubrobacteraceae bacterium]
MPLLLLAIAAVFAVAMPADESRRARPAQVPGLTLRQAVGQHMVYAYDGLSPPADLRRRIARGEAAGVILFARNVRSAAQVRAAMRSLQAIERPRGLRAPLIVMADQEGGPVRRIPGAPQRGAAAVRTVANARADGEAGARTLRGAGVNLDLAPVADVARGGAALEREGRTYGRSSAVVARLAAAFAGGLGAGGVRATAKHYPGFGAAAVNTDNAPARIETSLRTLGEVDEVPFARLISAGVPAVMLSTAVYPALDSQPAALSRRWIERLRGRLDFRGVTVSDDLATPAVAGFGSIGRRAVLAVRAGIDLPLFVSSYRDGMAAAAALLDATHDERLEPASLRAAAARVLALRAKLSD